LTIKVEGARIDQSFDLIGRMDPFPMIEHARNTDPSDPTSLLRKIKGPTHKNGHQTPKWDWHTELMFGGEPIQPDLEKPYDKLRFSLYEEDLTSNEFIGETEIFDLDELIELGSKKRANV
jgi:hypothetical protein